MKGILFPWGCFRLLCPVSDEMMQRSTILFVFHSPHTLPCQSKGRDRFLNLFSTSSCLHTLWGELSIVKLWPFLGHLSGESFLKLDPQISPNDGWLWLKLRYKKHELFFYFTSTKAERQWMFCHAPLGIWRWGPARLMFEQFPRCWKVC